MSKQSDENKTQPKGLRQHAAQLLTMGNLLRVPATIGTMRTFFDAVNWQAAEEDIKGELRRKIVIVGMANTGKSTLFNKIQGRYHSVVTPTPGTTQALVQGAFGPFQMIDTPGHLPDMQESAARDAAVILLLLDGTRKITAQDRTLLARLQALKRPLIVAVNKVDAVKGDPEDLAVSFGAQLGIKEVIPISGKVGTNLAEDLIPALIDASPEAALAIGHELPLFRRVAAERLIRNAALISLAAGVEPIPIVDIPILLGNQIRLVLRIAAVYGEPASSQYIKELVFAIAGGLAMRYLAGEAAKAVPFGGDLVSGAIAAAGTYAIGRVALEYFEGDKHLSTEDLRKLFTRFYTFFRSAEQSDAAATELGIPNPRPAAGR